MSAKKEKNLSFEARIAEAETIAAALGEGEMPLEDAMKAYERGVAIVRALEEELAACRKRIEMLDPETGEVRPFEEIEHDV